MSVGSQEVIDIERTENVTIDVNNSPVMETVTEGYVMVRWKRIIIGASLISLLVLPLLGGAIISYFLRNDLHQPVDPYNIWPDTDYKNQEPPEYVDADEDKGYSFRSDHHLLIKNGNDKFFTVSNGTNADMYMAVYMIENLWGSSEKYTIHVVTSTRKTNLSPLHDFSLLDHHDDLYYKLGMDRTYIDDTGIYEYYEHPYACIAAKVAKRFPISASTSSMNQKQIMTNIAAEINKEIKANPTEFYYPSIV